MAGTRNSKAATGAISLSVLGMYVPGTVVCARVENVWVWFELGDGE